MKKIISFLIISLFFVSVSAEYNTDKEYNSDGINTKMITTTSVKIMHQSWDLNLDGINDCENDGTCDDSIDYTKAKTYLDKEKFLQAEGQICKTATDSCNTIGVNNGMFTFSTEMYCEDVYGENGQEKYSCLSYDEEKIEKMKYIKNNISQLTDKNTVLGGTWYVTDINWKSDDEIMVSYEDGHIAEKITLSLSDLQDNQDDFRVCTMQYEPVCGEQKVQCIKAPCYPIEKTYGNLCMAGSNKFLYNGECNNYMNYELYEKYSKKEEKIASILEKIHTYKLNKMLELIEKGIETTKNLKIFESMKAERITAYIFLRDLINKELENR